MFISKIGFNDSGEAKNELLNWVKMHNQSEYSEHQLLWESFPNRGDEERSFIYRKERGGHSSFPFFYLVSEIAPISDRNFLQVLGIKEYDPQIVEGELLSFSVRINATISKKVPGKKNSVRHTIWQDARAEGLKNGLEDENLAEFIDLTTKEWLVSRAERNGFSISCDDFIVEGYEKITFTKKKNQKEISFGVVDYTGTLRVTNPLRFKELLFKGIGRSKAFGCGLMLVKRVQS